MDSLTPKNNKLDRLVEARLSLLDDYTGRETVHYVHSVLAQVSLPRKAVQERTFSRSSGMVGIQLDAGSLWDGSKFVQQPLPYGPMPRLIMAWVNAYAKKRKTREIPVGKSASEFLRLLGYASVSGGSRGVYTSFSKQSKALAACKMTLGYGKITVNERVFAQFEGLQGERSIWPGTLLLSDDYYNSLMEHATPLPLAALQALRGSALGLDILAFLAHRLRRVTKSEGEPVSWEALKGQFGQEYAANSLGMKSFKQEFTRALGDVLEVYRGARIEPLMCGGVQIGKLLLKSPPPVAD